MIYRGLGRSDLNVSAIGLGCWAFGGRNWGRVDERDSRKAIRAALNGGVNFFDTADIYGFGRSEELLGKELRSSPDSIVCTKVGLRLDRGGRVVHDLSPDHIRRACHESLQRLGRDRIDLYLLHWPDADVRLADSLSVLQDLVGAGKVRYFGASNLNPGDLAEASALDGFVAYQDEYNLAEWNATDDRINFCRDNNIGFITYKPLLKGLLTGKYTDKPKFGRSDHRRNLDVFNSDFERYRDLADGLGRIASDFGTTAAALALAALLDDVACVVPGAKTAEQVMDNIGACAVGSSARAAARDLAGSFGHGDR